MAVVASAVVANAAAVTWDSTKLFTAATADGGFSTTGVGNKASAYLFVLTESEYNTFIASYNADGNMKAVYDAYKDKLGDATKTGTTGARTHYVKLETSADVGETVYGALIYTLTQEFDGASKNFYIANIASGTVGAESGLTITNLGTYNFGVSSGTSAVATGGWQAVPEPTSGLLMLLGVAGLALRRRRA